MRYECAGGISHDTVFLLLKREQIGTCRRLERKLLHGFLDEPTGFNIFWQVRFARRALSNSQIPKGLTGTGCKGVRRLCALHSEFRWLAVFNLSFACHVAFSRRLCLGILEEDRLSLNRMKEVDQQSG
jgi:hypothetical protein